MFSSELVVIGAILRYRAVVAVIDAMVVEWIEDASLDTAERFHFISGVLELRDTSAIGIIITQKPKSLDLKDANLHKQSVDQR